MATIDDINSTLQNISRQLGEQAKSQRNGWPPATTGTSPLATGINTLGTAAISIIAASTTRHGIVFHNPGTVTAYIFPTLATSVTSSALGGSIIMGPGATLTFPSSQYPNINCAWSALATSGTANPFTIIEFF